MDNALPEFRFYYFTNRYNETIAFYRDLLELEIMRSWDRENGDKGTIFKSPNGNGFIEIEEGNEIPVLGGGLYVQVENVDEWYEFVLRKNIKIVDPLSDTSYGHHNFKIEDPNGMMISLFKYNRAFD